MRSSRLSPDAERRNVTRAINEARAVSGGSSVAPIPHWPLRDPARPRGLGVVFGVVVVTGIAIVAAFMAGFAFLAGAVGWGVLGGADAVAAFMAGFAFLAGAGGWGVLGGADAVVVLGVVLTRLNGAILRAVWTWCPRRISEIIGLVTAALAVTAPVPLFFSDDRRGAFFVILMVGCLATPTVGAVWGRSVPRE